MTNTILSRILNHKYRRVADYKARVDGPALRRKALKAPPCKDMISALEAKPEGAVIAEIKRSSPSAGKINPSLDPAEAARQYQANGAAAISVLTDNRFFGGSIDDLSRVSQAVELPLLRKDFIIDPIQLHQTRLAGADAVLLIVAALSTAKLHDLYHQALDLGLNPLIEVHDKGELERALALNAGLIGINNRDLATLEVSLETCLGLRPLIPAGVTVVGESGISSPEDLDRLKAGGINAFLIGTALMASPAPGQALAALINGRPLNSAKAA